MADDQYQEGWQQPAALPDITPDITPGGLLDGLPKSSWSLADSSLNTFLDPETLADIDLTGTRPQKPPPWSTGASSGMGGLKSQPTPSLPAQPDGGGFYTGLTPFDPNATPPLSTRNGLNGAGYVPQPGDSDELARLIMAEGAGTQQDMPALGWSVVNRIGNREFGQSLDQVTNKKGAFQSVQDGGGLWGQSANPESFTGSNAQAWTQAQATAQGILSGAIPDPTGGATLFFSSDHYNPANAQTAPLGWYPKALEQGNLVPSLSYPSTPDRTSGNRNYFFVENPHRK